MRKAEPFIREAGAGPAVAAIAALRIPVLVMTGGRSTFSAHGVVRRLLPLLPQARLHTFPELGHMAPVTHPEEINGVLVSFLSAA